MCSGQPLVSALGGLWYRMQHRMFMPFLLLFFFFFVLARRRGERQCCVAAGVADKAPCNETGDPK